jgi:hemoglobin-like flavoprotein
MITSYIFGDDMMITADQITLVQTSFAQVTRISDQAADMFYNRLFEIDPSLRGLFRSDIKEQGRKLMQMLAVAVNGLDHLDSIIPAVQDLGRRHIVYGVKAADYQTVGAALLWTLEQGLGDAFTPEVEAAWAAAYTLLADTASKAA